MKRLALVVALAFLAVGCAAHAPVKLVPAPKPEPVVLEYHVTPFRLPNPGYATFVAKLTGDLGTACPQRVVWHFGEAPGGGSAGYDVQCSERVFSALHRYPYAHVGYETTVTVVIDGTPYNALPVSVVIGGTQE